MSYPEDPFPNLKPYPEGLDFWERDRASGLVPQVSLDKCECHVSMPKPNGSKIMGTIDLPSEATPTFTERQYFWSGDKLWNRKGGPLGADELATDLSGTVADVNDPGSADGTVAFDIFPGQTGGSYSSQAVVEGGRITDYTITLPYIDLSSYATDDKFMQFRQFLKDVPLLHPRNTATIRDGIPYLYYGRENTLKRVPASRLVGLVEDLVSTYVNESTADTLDEYPAEI